MGILTVSDYKNKISLREYDPKGQTNDEVYDELISMGYRDDEAANYLTSYRQKKAPAATPPVSDFEKTMNRSTAMGIGIESAKMGVNASRWARNNATEAPQDIQFKRTSLMNPELVDPDYNPIDSSSATMMAAAREGGKASTYLNAIHRNTLKAKNDMNIKVGQTNAQIKNQVAQANAGIEGKNNEGQLNVDILNANRSFQFSQYKQGTQDAIVNSVFDNATNMGNYMTNRGQQLEAKRNSDEMMENEKNRIAIGD